MKTTLMKFTGMAILAIGVSSVCSAAVPEIDPATGGNALALLAGALLIMRGRRR
jgi:hypothetical protein